MRKIIPNIVLTFSFILLYSCGEKNLTSSDPVVWIDTIKVTPSSVVNERTNYSSLFNRIEYIQISISKDYIIGNTDKLLVTDNYFLIMDSKISRAAFVFDKVGHEVVSIKKTGNGPGEYVEMKDMAFDKEKEELYIHDYVSRKMLCYDLKGNLLKDDNIPYASLRVQPVGNSFVLCTDYSENSTLQQKGKKPDLILLTSDMRRVLSTANYFRQPSSRSVVISSRAKFSQINDTLYSVKPDHSNIVYHVTPNDIYPAYRIDFGTYNIDDRYWDKASERGMTYEKINEYSKKNGFCESFWFLEGAKYIYFAYRQYEKLHYVLYSKETKNMHHIKYYQNNMDLVTAFRPIAVHDDKFYCLLNPEEVYKIKEHLVGIIPDSILNNVQEFGNPIIVAFTVKPF